MHKLLARQIRAAKRADGNVDVDALIGIIDQAYGEFDRERRLNDRAAKLTEDELIAANEQATREHNSVLATILESAPDGMLVTGTGDRIETANEAAERQFKAEPGGLVGRRLDELLPINEMRREGYWNGGSDQRQTGEVSALSLDGESFRAEYSISPMGTGSCVRNLWIVRDISERIRAQREIQESQLRFQDLAEASSDCFWEMDRDLAQVKATSPGNAKNAASIVRVLTHKPGGQAPSGAQDESWEQLPRPSQSTNHSGICGS